MEIAVASGKGGTGKTFIASNLIAYLKRVGVDADVEEPDLLLALGGGEKIEEKGVFKKVPVIKENCKKCLKCLEICKFNAIKIENNKVKVDYEKCEGCLACYYLCPHKAIDLKDYKIGKIEIYKTKYGIILTGILNIGEGNSGKIVNELKKEAYKFSSKYYVIDCAPGTGCPVISSICGSDLLILVIEPTYQSFKGALKLKEIAEKFGIKTIGIINKFDLNREFCKEIEKEIEIVGKIPFSKEVIESYMKGVPIIENKESKIAKELISIFETII